MKLMKLLAILLCSFLVISMVACGEETENESKRETLSTQVTTSSREESKEKDTSETSNEQESGYYKTDARYIRANLLGDAPKLPNITVIRSKEDLETYKSAYEDIFHFDRKDPDIVYLGLGFLDACDRYDKAFFDSNKILVLITTSESSGSYRYVGTNVLPDDHGGTKIEIDRYEPTLAAEDMAYWHLFVDIQLDQPDTEIEPIELHFVHVQE